MRDAEGTPFVVLAAEQTSHETLEVLLSKTTDPSTGRTRLDLEMFDEDVPRSDGGQVKKGYAALATAIMAGCEQSVRLLMNHGADISRGVYGETALYSVLRAEMGGLVDDFLEREPDLSRGKELYVVYSDPEDRVLLERLLDAGAPIDAAPNGWTILQSAVTGEDTELVRFLLERGADPTLQTQSSPSAIEIATEEGLTDILGLLQQAAAGPNATSEEPAWELKLPTAQACEPIMRAPSPTPRADARSTEDEWQPERRRPGHWMPIVHISLDGEVVQSGDSVYDFEDPDPAEFARLQQRLVNMARRMTPEFNEALQTDLPDDALVIRADERTPFAYVSQLMEACARPEVRIWKLEFAVQRAVLRDETPQECRISVHLPIDSGEPSFELRVSADVLEEGRPRRDSERSQDGEDPDESQERIIRYDVDGLRTQDIEKARLFIQAAGDQEGGGRPRATLHLSPGVLHGEVIALLDELSSAGFEDFAFVANDPGRSGR